MTMIFLSLLFIIIVSWVLDLKFWRTTLKINLFGLFPGWNHGGWRREERGFCCARNSRRISQSTWDQASEQKFAPKMLQKARRKLIHEKAKHYHKEYIQADIQNWEFRLGWQEKSATSMCMENPNWHLSSGSELSVVWAQRSEKVAASLPLSDFQWHLFEVQQGFN